ncbi:hypothetical protein N665_0232s0030 [Sinapis alba]|nr:hypothetical protein N665_0232s0030 [Sinapis alba]
MEGKTVILSVTIVSLVLAQIQVEAVKTCCPTTNARHIIDRCLAIGIPMIICLDTTGCVISTRPTCPPNFPANRLDNSADAVNEYCKLGCTSSECGPLTTLQNSGASEIGDGAVEHCAEACSTLCTNGSTKLAVETA